MEVEKDDCEFERIFDHYFKDVILLLKERNFCETLVEDNIKGVIFEDLNKDVPVELETYIINHVLEASIINCPFNAWAVKVIKGCTRSIRFLYRVKDIVRSCRL